MANDPTLFKNVLLNCFCCSNCGFYILNSYRRPYVEQDNAELGGYRRQACDPESVINNNPTSKDLKAYGGTLSDYLLNEKRTKNFSELLSINKFAEQQDKYLSDSKEGDNYNRMFPLYLTDDQIKKLREKKLTGSYSVNSNEKSYIFWSQTLSINFSPFHEYYYENEKEERRSYSVSKNGIKITEKTDPGISSLNNEWLSLLPWQRYYYSYAFGWYSYWSSSSSSLNEFTTKRELLGAYKSILAGTYRYYGWWWWWYGWGWGQWNWYYSSFYSENKNILSSLPYILIVNRTVNNGFVISYPASEYNLWGKFWEAQKERVAEYGWWYAHWYGWWYSFRPHLGYCDTSFGQEFFIPGFFENEKEEEKNSASCYSIHFMAGAETNYYFSDRGYRESPDAPSSYGPITRDWQKEDVALEFEGALVTGGTVTDQNDKNYQKRKCYFFLIRASSVGITLNFDCYRFSRKFWEQQYGYLRNSVPPWYAYWYGWWWGGGPHLFFHSGLNTSTSVKLNFNLFDNNLSFDMTSYASPDIYRNVSWYKTYDDWVSYWYTRDPWNSTYWSSSTSFRNSSQVNYSANFTLNAS